MWLAAVVVFAVLVGVTEAPGPEARFDDAEALHALMTRAEAVDHIVDYRFTRTTGDGRRTASTVVEARVGDARLTRAGSTLTLVLPERRYDCDTGADGPACIERPATRAVLSDADVVLTAAATGAYDVFPAPEERIAGESARCFRVQVHVVDPAQRLLPGLGRRTTLCLATSDGVLLRSATVTDAGTDELVATRVVRDPATDLVREVIGEYEGQPGVSGG